MKGEIHQNDVGTVFQSQIHNENDLPLDVSVATDVSFAFSKPDKTIINRTGQFVSDGKDGWVQYTTQVNDLDKVGNWQMQVVVSMPYNKMFHSDIVKFRVMPNL